MLAEILRKLLGRLMVPLLIKKEHPEAKTRGFGERMLRRGLENTLVFARSAIDIVEKNGERGSPLQMSFRLYLRIRRRFNRCLESFQGFQIFPDVNQVLAIVNIPARKIERVNRVLRTLLRLGTSHP
jgi:hypothetical protein